MATVPIVLAGAMTVSMNLTGPLESASAATETPVKAEERTRQITARDPDDGRQIQRGDGDCCDGLDRAHHLRGDRRRHRLGDRRSLRTLDGIRTRPQRPRAGSR